MVTHSSILAWEIPWTEEPGGLQSMGLQRVGYGEQLSMYTHNDCYSYLDFFFPILQFILFFFNLNLFILIGG